MLPRKSEPLTHGCCHGGAPYLSSWSRSGWELAAAALSLGIWAFMPKCPLCLAAYVALWTGLGLSFTVVSYLRWSLLLLSGLLLCYLMLKRKA